MIIKAGVSSRRIRELQRAFKAGSITSAEMKELTDQVRYMRNKRRIVRTPEGSKRFKVPIGSPIPGPGEGKLKPRRVKGQTVLEPGSVANVRERELPGTPLQQRQSRGPLQPGRSLTQVGEGRVTRDPIHERIIDPNKTIIDPDTGKLIVVENPNPTVVLEGSNETMRGYGLTQGEKKMFPRRARPMVVKPGAVVGGHRLSAEEAQMLNDINQIEWDADEPAFHIPLVNLGQDYKGGLFVQAKLAHLSPDERLAVIRELVSHPPEDVLNRQRTKFRIPVVQRIAREVLDQRQVRPETVLVGNKDQTRNHRAPTEDRAIRNLPPQDVLTRRLKRLHYEYENGTISFRTYQLLRGRLEALMRARHAQDGKPAQVTPEEFQRELDMLRGSRRWEAEAPSARQEAKDRGAAKRVERKSRGTNPNDIHKPSVDDILREQRRRKDEKKRQEKVAQKAGGITIPKRPAGLPTSSPARKKKKSAFARDYIRQEKAKKKRIGKADPAFIRAAIAAAKKWKSELHPRDARGKWRKKGGGQGMFTQAGLQTLKPKQRDSVVGTWLKTTDAQRAAAKQGKVMPSKQELRRIAREQGLAGMVTAAGVYEGMDKPRRDKARKKLIDQNKVPASGINEGKKGRAAFDREAASTSALDDHLSSGGSVWDAPSDNLYDSLLSSSQLAELNKMDSTEHVSEAYTFKTKNGELGFVKATANEYDVDGFMLGDSHAEVAVSGIAGEMGMIVPRARFASDPNDVPNGAVLTQHIDDVVPDGWELEPEAKTLDEALDITDIDPDEIVQLAVLDYLTNQGDRHGGNWRIARDQNGVRHIIVMDNGGAFTSMMENMNDPSLTPEALGGMDVGDYIGSWDSKVNQTGGVASMVSDAFGNDEKKIAASIQKALDKITDDGMEKVFGSIVDQTDPGSEADLLLQDYMTIFGERVARLRGGVEDAAKTYASVSRPSKKRKK